MAEAMRGRLSAWEDFRFTADEYHEIDGERILVFGHDSGRGKASGLDVAQMRALGAALFHVRRGKVTRLVRYFNRDRAFADLGLKEQALSRENVERRRTWRIVKRGDFSSPGVGSTAGVR
jgi:hypothetical protein